MTVIEFAGHGVRLAADVEGPEGGPTVLLLHGGGQTRHSWGLAVRALSSAGTRCVALDLRGHGDSGWASDGSYGPESISKDVEAVVGQLAGPVVIVGASLGGMTGLLTAAALGPDHVPGLVLVDVVPRIRLQGAERIVGFMRAAPDGFASLEEAADAIGDYLPHRPRRGVTPGLRRNLRQRPDGRWVWHWDPAFMHGREPGHIRQSVPMLEEAAASLRIPVAVVRGMLSDVVDDAGLDSLRVQVPDLQVYDLQGAAHTAAADDNDAFSAAVIAFLAAMRAVPGA